MKSYFLLALLLVGCPKPIPPPGKIDASIPPTPVVDASTPPSCDAVNTNLVNLGCIDMNGDNSFLYQVCPSMLRGGDYGVLNCFLTAPDCDYADNKCDTMDMTVTVKPKLQVKAKAKK